MKIVELATKRPNFPPAAKNSKNTASILVKNRGLRPRIFFYWGGFGGGGGGNWPLEPSKKMKKLEKQFAGPRDLGI